MAVCKFGDRSFPSMGQAKAEFQRILKAAPLRTPLTGADLDLVWLLISEGQHPEKAEKIGAGITAIDVRLNGRYGTRGFWLVRTDGTEADFSYLVALSGGRPHQAEVIRALRWEVDPQIQQFRDSVELPARCELCSTLISSGHSAHVDHADPPFSLLANRFAEVIGGWHLIAVECFGPAGRQLRDRGLAQVWHMFHQRTARLRLTHQQCNLTRETP